MTKLQEHLNSRGMSRSALSRLTGIQLKTISALCEGRRGGRMDTWRLIAQKLRCNLSDILE